METITLLKIVGLILAFPIGAFLAYALVERVPRVKTFAVYLSKKINVDREKDKKEEIINNPELLAEKLKEGGKSFYHDKEKDVKFIDDGNEIKIEVVKDHIEFNEGPLPRKPKSQVPDPGSTPGAGVKKKKRISKKDKAKAKAKAKAK